MRNHGLLPSRLHLFTQNNIMWVELLVINICFSQVCRELCVSYPVYTSQRTVNEIRSTCFNVRDHFMAACYKPASPVTYLITFAS